MSTTTPQGVSSMSKSGGSSLLSRLASALGGKKKDTKEQPSARPKIKTKAQARLEAESKNRKQAATAAAKPEPASKCPKCKASVSKGSRRCMRCGAVMQTAGEKAGSAPVGNGGGYRELSALTPLQVQILVGLSQVREAESVCTVFNDDAKVTVYDLTFEGDKAVQAVGLLQDSGYLTARDNQSFTLSMSGKHLAELAMSSTSGRSA
ncbi:hypothetical protein ABI59_18095 [Acidobacteria bacterium Mor1]|nr:hypothetical protein ABI59_18095 [Acidobacteria bacterium Mor1]